MELDKAGREAAQDWHPKGLIPEELIERNRVLVRICPQPTPEIIRTIITTSKPFRNTSK